MSCCNCQAVTLCYKSYALLLLIADDVIHTHHTPNYSLQQRVLCRKHNQLLTILILRTMFMLLSSWQAVAIVHPVHLMHAEQCQTAVYHHTKPTNTGSWFSLYAANVYAHDCQYSTIKAGTHFIEPIWACQVLRHGSLPARMTQG